MVRKVRNYRKSGFTLIELMIVVAIIAIVAAVAIPSLTEARRSANEAAALGTLKKVLSSVESYRIRFRSVPDFGDLIAAGYVDAQEFDLSTGSPTRQGYRLSLTLTSGTRYWVLSTPMTPADGNRSFAYSMDPALPLQHGILLVQNVPGGLWAPLD